jgi:8-oxo-dGTP diphosphatase
MQTVSAGVIEKNNKILIAKRKKGKCLEALWEFPGGKLEENETIQECLKREIKEELDIEIKVGKFLCKTEFFCTDKKIVLMTFMAEYISGILILNDHDDAKWVSLNELNNYEFVRADKEIVKALLINSNL